MLPVFTTGHHKDTFFAEHDALFRSFLRLSYYIFQNYGFLRINRTIYAIFYIRTPNNVPKARSFDTKQRTKKNKLLN